MIKVKHSMSPERNIMIFFCYRNKFMSRSPSCQTLEIQNFTVVCFLYIGYQDTIQLSPAVAHITSTPSTKITTATNPIGADKIDSNCLPVSCTVDEQRIMHVSGKIAFSSEVIIVSSGHS